MDMIELDMVLDLFATDIWLSEQGLKREADRQEHRLMTLAEKQQTIATWKARAVADKNVIRLTGENSTMQEIEAHNYFLIRRDSKWGPFRDGASKVEAYDWSIIGFTTFAQLNKYLDRQESLFHISVFIKDDLQYKKTLCRFAIQYPEGESVFTDESGFYFPNQMLWDEWERDPLLRYSFEIVGLCELCDAHGTFCMLVNSLDDLLNRLEGLLFSMDLDRANEKTGTALYAGTQYSYRL